VFWFYWLHAGPLAAILGTRGLWLALPTAAGGALWAWATLKTKSLWPAIVSHWAVEVAILSGVYLYLRP
jgi:membrane protease YdiL (CAAX protease family)